MFTLENACLALTISADAGEILLHDRRRGTRWRLSRQGYRLADATEPSPLPAGRVTTGDSAIEVCHAIPGGELCFRWTLETDHLAVTLDVRAPDVAEVALPGSWLPDDEAAELALPLYQGVLLRSTPEDWERRSRSGGHGAFSMAMGGVMGASGALLVAQENVANWTGVYGMTSGRPHVCFAQEPCPVDGWTPRTVRLFPVEATVAAVCLRYRDYIKSRGLFMPWAEKLARKPILRRLFGALMAFTGYNHIPDFDYAGNVRRLKAYGFENILLYPVRFLHPSLDFKMGGDDPVWLSDAEIARVHAIDGALVAPWTWLFEGLDDGTPERRRYFRQNADGSFMPHWKIDSFQWYMGCPAMQQALVRERLAGAMTAMDWLHFDVTATFPPTPCFSADHGHPPLSREADVRANQRLLSPETVGNRIVSSEGFIGHFTPYYDIGSTKKLPEDFTREVPLPMTMLVYHDSCVHDWWELHNYNAIPPCFGMSGQPNLKAALDALYGCPPNVFPFGRQYGWTNFETRESFAFTITLDDPSVQEALRAALPVARLHGRIGMCAMTDFRLLNDAGTAQATTFSDGTRVFANLGDTEVTIENTVLPAQSWESHP